MEDTVPIEDINPIEVKRTGHHIFITRLGYESHVQSVINLNRVGNFTMSIDLVNGARNLFLKADGEVTNFGLVSAGFCPSSLFKQRISIKRRITGLGVLGLALAAGFMWGTEGGNQSRLWQTTYLEAALPQVALTAPDARAAPNVRDAPRDEVISAKEWLSK